jgi:hypothetical protein
MLPDKWAESFIAAAVVATVVVTALFWLMSLVVVMRRVWQWTFA